MKNKTIKYEKNNPKIISSKSFSKHLKKVNIPLLIQEE